MESEPAAAPQLDDTPQCAAASRAVMRLVCALALVLALGQTVELNRGVSCMDYFHFWAVARAVQHSNGIDIYSDEQRVRMAADVQRDIRASMRPDRDPKLTSKTLNASQQWQAFHTFSTPWLYTLVGSLSSRSDDVLAAYASDQDRFQLLSLAAFVLGLGYVCRALGYGGPATAILLVTILLWFEPVLADTAVGNVGRLQVGALALWSWITARSERRRSQLAAGAVLGLLVAFKPNLAYVAVTLSLGWVLTSRLHKLAWQGIGALAGGAAAFGASMLYFHSWLPWLQWSGQIPQLTVNKLERTLSEGNIGLMRGNYSTARAIYLLLGTNQTFFLGPLLLAALAVALFVRRRRGRERVQVVPSTRAHREREFVFDLALLAAGCALSLLGAQIAWLHYFVLALPCVLLALRPRPESSARWASLSQIAVLVGFLATARLPVRLAFESVGETASALLLAGGTLILFALTLLECARPAESALEALPSGEHRIQPA